ncbi:unnamed protein product [Cochlearia groenlandica]
MRVFMILILFLVSKLFRRLLRYRELRINWVTLNPHGELLQYGESQKEVSVVDSGLSKFESFDLKASDVMEEDSMGDEPGLVYFEVWPSMFLVLVVHGSYE